MKRVLLWERVIIVALQKCVGEQKGAVLDGICPGKESNGGRLSWVAATG